MAVINKTGITNGGTIEVGHVTRSIDALSGVGTDTIIATGSFSGSLIGTMTGTLTGTASTASVVPVTDTTTGTGPYFIAFTDGTTGAQAIRVDSAALTFNATTNVLATTASFATSASFATTASFATSGSRAVSASFATTASFALNASSFPFTGSARVTGSLGVTGSLNVTGSASITGSIVMSGNITMTGNLAGFNKASTVDFSGIGDAGTGNFRIPLGASSSPLVGSMYFRSDTGTLFVYDGTQWLSFQSA